MIHKIILLIGIIVAVGGALTDIVETRWGLQKTQKLRYFMPLVETYWLGESGAIVMKSLVTAAGPDDWPLKKPLARLRPETTVEGAAPGSPRKTQDFPKGCAPRTQDRQRSGAVALSHDSKND